MTTPGDESRTELAWREIVENYGERAVLPDDQPARPVDSEDRRAPVVEPATPEEAAGTGAGAETGAGAGAETGAGTGAETGAETIDGTGDETGVDTAQESDDDLPEVDRFRPPVAPPFPRPRTWQRGLAWAGVFLAPVLALVVGLFSIYVAPLFGWALVIWFVGGFLYLVREMPRAPRDPWDDGSRI